MSTRNSRLAIVRLVAVALMMCAFLTVIPAQIITDRGKRSDEIQVKIRRLELLIQIVPLALNKTQLNDLLTSIEEVRQEWRQVLRQEDDELAKLEGRIDEAIKQAEEGGQYPRRELQNEIATVTRVLGTRRELILNDWTDKVYAAVKKIFNEGQIKAMENSLDLKFFNPALKDEDLTPERRQRFYVQFILLDPMAYEVLTTLHRNART